jgi:hypothetical protein
MENSTIVRYFRPSQVLCLVITLALILVRTQADSWGPGWKPAVNVLLVGNALLFLVTLFSFSLYRKGLNDKNPLVFLRMMYSSMIVKMVICAGAATIYFYIARKEVSKAGILGCFALYMVYTFLEVTALTRLSKLQKDA